MPNNYPARARGCSGTTTALRRRGPESPGSGQAGRPRCWDECPGAPPAVRSASSRRPCSRLAVQALGQLPSGGRPGAHAGSAQMSEHRRLPQDLLAPGDSNKNREGLIAGAGRGHAGELIDPGHLSSGSFALGMPVAERDHAGLPGAIAVGPPWLVEPLFNPDEVNAETKITIRYGRDGQVRDRRTGRSGLICDVPCRPLRCSRRVMRREAACSIDCPG